MKQFDIGEQHFLALCWVLSDARHAHEEAQKAAARVQNLVRDMPSCYEARPSDDREQKEIADAIVKNLNRARNLWSNLPLQVADSMEQEFRLVPPGNWQLALRIGRGVATSA